MCKFIDLNGPDAWTIHCSECGAELCTSCWSVGKSPLCIDCERKEAVWTSDWKCD